MDLKQILLVVCKLIVLKTKIDEIGMLKSLLDSDPLGRIHPQTCFHET